MKIKNCNGQQAGYRNIDRQLNHFFDNFFSSFDQAENKTYSPKVNITEDEESFQLQLATPGLEKEKIKLTVEKNELVIATAKNETTTKNDDHKESEKVSSYEFSKRFKLPKNVVQEKINAAYTNGVLHVTLPKIATDDPSQHQEIDIS